MTTIDPADRVAELKAENARLRETLDEHHRALSALATLACSLLAGLRDTREDT